MFIFHKFLVQVLFGTLCPFNVITLFMLLSVRAFSKANFYCFITYAASRMSCLQMLTTEHKNFCIGPLKNMLFYEWQVDLEPYHSHSQYAVGHVELNQNSSESGIISSMKTLPKHVTVGERRRIIYKASRRTTVCIYISDVSLKYRGDECYI